MNFTFSSVSEAGPRKANEDSVGVWPGDGFVNVCIADGLGGMGGGDVASQMSVAVLGEVARSGPLSVNRLEEIALLVHARILTAQSSGEDSGSMATTFTAASIAGDRLQAVHCGDTRILAMRGSGIKRLTDDQTEGQRLFDEGKLSKEELRDYPRRNILDSALGSRRSVRLQGVEFVIEVGDRILLTSDGVHELLSMRQILDLSLRSSTASELTGLIRQEVILVGPQDNFSVIAVFCG